ncbi:protein phosphatase 1 regulatory subunit 12C [Heracleum sosnowskyi]|uniref:Protein phosphatase 1 regulatory subunit 12C n=1 Tax=Heracleum sosnowskyi TaxID=360622 RepID=A0AAD8M3M8_9APIA|nr:protein phosphatase 1 regulatory subunit 12C [Heracleum sosnowskyi]
MVSNDQEATAATQPELNTVNIPKAAPATQPPPDFITVDVRERPPRYYDRPTDPDCFDDYCDFPYSVVVQHTTFSSMLRTSTSGEFLCENKADVGAATMDDMGAIHFAAQKGHLKVVQILISSGVSVKSANRKGMTALHYAAQGSSLELVKYLVKKDGEKKPEDISELSKKNEEDIKTESDVSKSEDAQLVKDESTKRKNDSEDDAKDFSEPKKAKIALNHLLASDDAQEDEDNL